MVVIVLKGVMLTSAVLTSAVLQSLGKAFAAARRLR